MSFAVVSPKTKSLEIMEKPITVLIRTTNDDKKDGQKLDLKEATDQHKEQHDGANVTYENGKDEDGYPMELCYSFGHADDIKCSSSDGKSVDVECLETESVDEELEYWSSRRYRLEDRIVPSPLRNLKAPAVKQEDCEQAKVINAAATLSSLSPFKATCTKCWERKIKHNDPDDFAIVIGEGQQPVKITSEVLRAMLSAMGHAPNDSQENPKFDIQSIPDCSACGPSLMTTDDLDNKEKSSKDGVNYGKRENGDVNAGDDSESSKKKRKTWFWPFF